MGVSLATKWVVINCNCMGSDKHRLVFDSVHYCTAVLYCNNDYCNCIMSFAVLHITLICMSVACITPHNIILWMKWVLINFWILDTDTDTVFKSFFLLHLIIQEASMYKATQELQHLDMVVQESLCMDVPTCNKVSLSILFSLSSSFHTLLFFCISQLF